ncbi:MAG: TPR domain protein [Candidatus Amesbacteria bacterium GW2011_GWA2_47_11b]|uniref:TPR domain protein n=1 Tax=Candidatus Amesbacteria bacterium GW2011_GWA2_47_11b TaxID=1618358 RepID=A0A0G1UI23_9BACT|nr:MAG: TPR domain protein [Candidatus Amesbacteria bacterium GW2011_GWA2_47_11b]
MTNSQKIGIFLVLSVAGWALWATGRYWLADVYYAAGQKNYQFFQKTQDSQYLISSFQSLQSAVKLNPSEPAILSEYAVDAAYLSTAVDTKNIAATAAQRAISLSPHHPNYYKSAARVYILLSDLPSAAEVLTQAAKISPTDPRLPYNLGLIYESLGQTDLARQAYEHSLSLKPDFADAKAILQKLNP